MEPLLENKGPTYNNRFSNLRPCLYIAVEWQLTARVGPVSQAADNTTIITWIGGVFIAILIFQPSLLSELWH